MALKQKVMGVTLGVSLSLSISSIHPAWADTLTQLHNQMKHVHKKRDAKKTEIKKEKGKLGAVHKQKAQAIRKSQQLIHEISDTQDRISQKQSDVKHTKHKISQLKNEIAATEKRIKRRNQLLKKRVRYMYKNGSSVRMIQVLLGSQSFSDFIDRVYALHLINKQDKQLLDSQIADKKKLVADQEKVKKELDDLQNKLDSLKNLKAQLKQKQQKQQTLIEQLKSEQHQIQTHVSNQKDALIAIQSKLAKLEEQAKQQEKILASRNSSSSIVVASLRYHPISPKKLYTFVKNKGSAFSLNDIKTICNVARSYNVNPALMVAITGQELSFVQNGTSYESEKLVNPFDVFGSWALYHTTLAQSAAYAAQIIQVKLSVSPPAGEDPIIWINDLDNHAGLGVYATDPHWAYGVRTFFKEIEAYVSS
ncbi:MAG TPA: hypothetical protein VFK33_02455 [Bacillales bacterium]|nr:hypothetical protein [Bacillales bacterium]